MGGNGRHKWKISFYHRSPASPSTSTSKTEVNPNPSSDSNPNSAREPPKDYLCPVHGSLMADPVVVASGHTFERVTAELCRDLGITPAIDDGSEPDFSAIITNKAIASAILAWCEESGVPPPHAPTRAAVERLLRGGADSELRVSERELIEHVADNPPVMFSHAETELGRRANNHHNHRRFYSTSSEESVVISAENPSTPLPFTTRPLSYNNYSSSSSSDNAADLESLAPATSEEEEELTRKMKSHDVVDQEEAAISLRKLTRTREELRSSLCTPRLLQTLKPLIASRYSVVQTNAIAALVNLSLEKPNKVSIVRSGFVPYLIDTLKSGSSEAQEHAAGALFSLALEDDNKMAIGVLGALPPLMHSLVRSESDRTRQDSALALYHLTLVQSNRAKLVRLGSVPTLLGLSQEGSSASRVLLILCNLAACPEGRSAMLDASAVSILVGMLGRRAAGSESTRENAVAALFALSHGNMRFRGLARDAGAVEALRVVEEKGSDRAREKARRMLQMMRGRGDGDDDEDDDGDADEDGGGGWRSLTAMAGGGGAGDMNASRYRAAGIGRNLHGANSTTF